MEFISTVMLTIPNSMSPHKLRSSLLDKKPIAQKPRILPNPRWMFNSVLVVSQELTGDILWEPVI